MSAESPQTGCRFRWLVCKNGVIAALFVLLAVATTGWIVTATRKPPAPEPETVEVLVAAKDIPVGTTLTRDDLIGDRVVKTKKVPKGELPPVFITNKEDLVDKRLSRPVRAEETFNPQDLSRSMAVVSSIYDPDTLAVQAPAQYVAPKSRVNVYATRRVGNKSQKVLLLVDKFVIEVTTETVEDREGVFPATSMVSLYLVGQQWHLLSLAKSRGCTLEIVPRDPDKIDEAEKDYDIDKVIKFLTDMREIAPPPRPVKE